MREQIGRWCCRAFVPAVLLLVLVACGGEAALEVAGTTTVAEAPTTTAAPTTAASGGPPATLTPEYDGEDIVFEGDRQPCIYKGLRSNDELAVLIDPNTGAIGSYSDVTPSAVDDLAQLFGRCLGPDGLAEFVSLGISGQTGSEISAESFDCLASRFEGDEVSVMLIYAEAAGAEVSTAEAVDVVSGHMAACLPLSSLSERDGTSDLELCGDRLLVGTPALQARWRAYVTGSELTQAESDALIEPLYDCEDMPSLLWSGITDLDGMSSEALVCVAETARSFSVLNGTLDEETNTEFRTEVVQCFTAEELILMQSLS